MKPAITGREAAEDEDLLVHDWRVARLAQFGIPGRWPRSMPTSSTGTRSAAWCSAAVPRGWPCASSADECPSGSSAPRTASCSPGRPRATLEQLPGPLAPALVVSRRARLAGEGSESRQS